MAGRFYDVLGVTQKATSEEIRTAYRKLVKKYHPDHSSDPSSTEMFLKVQEAYEVLSDPARRTEFDRLQELQEQLRKQKQSSQARKNAAPPKAEAPRTAQPPPPKEQPKPKPQATLAGEVTRLSMLFSKGRIAEAESLARKIITMDARVALPYAVLGDVARQKGNLAEASKMYAYAAQFDPNNSVYLRKHEELMTRVSTTRTSVTTTAKPEPISPAPFVGFGIAIIACTYLVLSRESSILPGIKLINTWTLGLVVMLFISGVAVGASLSAGRLLDGFDSFTTNAVGKISPSLALAPIALVSFWAAGLLYVLLGLGQKSFAYSISRLLASVAAVVFLTTLSAMISGRIEPMQVFAWGGNIAYFGALCGWMVADSLRQA